MKESIWGGSCEKLWQPLCSAVVPVLAEGSAPPTARYVLVSCVVHAHTCMKDGDILLDHIWPILWDEISPWTWSSPISFQLGKLAGRPPWVNLLFLPPPLSPGEWGLNQHFFNLGSETRTQALHHIWDASKKDAEPCTHPSNQVLLTAPRGPL